MSEEITPPVPAVEPDIAAMLEAISAELKGIQTQLDEREEPLPPAVVETPLPPQNDPDYLPPTDWKALREEMRSEADTRAEAKFNAKLSEQQAAADTKAQFESDLEKQFDALADEAVAKGFLPSVTDDSNFNDPGKVARRELFGFAAKLGSTNLVDVAENLKALHDNGQRYDVQTQKLVIDRPQNPGRFAPVGSSSARTSGPTGQMDYKTLHTTSLEMLGKRAMQE